MTEQDLAPRESALRIFWARTVELLRSNPVPLFVAGVITLGFLVPYIWPPEGRREAFPPAIQKQVDRECTCPRVKPKAAPKVQPKAQPKKPRVVIVPPGDPRATGWPIDWNKPSHYLGGPKK